MARRPRYEDDDDYDDPPAPPPARAHPSMGGAIAIGALGGLVGGEGMLILNMMDFLRPNAGPGAALLGIGLCFGVFLLAPFFVLLGMVGGVAAARTHSSILGALLGAVSGPALIFLLWACDAIKITVNGQPVKFNLDMALWCSARLWVPGAIGGLFAGLMTSGSKPPPPPSRSRRRFDEDEDDEDEDNRQPYRRRR
jgi:hypothetical protein